MDRRSGGVPLQRHEPVPLTLAARANTREGWPVRPPLSCIQIPLRHAFVEPPEVLFHGTAVRRLAA
jgi:hypothetical protein